MCSYAKKGHTTNDLEKWALTKVEFSFDDMILWNVLLSRKEFHMTLESKYV